MTDTFADANGNFSRDGEDEKTSTFNLAAAYGVNRGLRAPNARK